jgi:hypothetical protein
MEPHTLEPDVVTGPYPPAIEQAMPDRRPCPMQHKPIVSAANVF